MSGDLPRQGMLDTNIMILRRWIDPGQLPDEMAISAITLAELSAGPHEVRRNSEQDMYDEHAERARRRGGPHLRAGNGSRCRRRAQATKKNR
jgi:predicted nucleic acid-binding protein